MDALALPYFLALPSTPAPWPGVVVIHEGNGISQQLLRLCERLASSGIAAIAPDLFFRTGGPGGADLVTMTGGLDDGRTTSDLEAAAATLCRAGAARLGVIGFCLGGHWAWRMARSETFSAAAGFYGVGIVGDLDPPACPTLLLFGDQDPWIPPADLERICGAHEDTYVYEGAGHGFMRDGSEDHNEAAAADAWERVQANFDEHLRCPPTGGRREQGAPREPTGRLDGVSS